MVLPCWFRRRSRGSARNGRAVKALPTALRARHEKRKFAKRTWNVSWNQQINFLVRSTDPVVFSRTHRKRHHLSFPTRRSSDLERTQPLGAKPECVLE